MEEENKRFEQDASASTLIITAVIALLVGVAVWRSWRKDTRNRQTRPNTSQCTSPNCVRCRGERFKKDQLMQRCKDYLSEANQTAEDPEQCLQKNYPRVLSLLRSVDHKNDILRSMYNKSGYKAELSELQPHIWMLPELKQAPIWNAADHKELDQVATVFENEHAFGVILSEYECISKQHHGWKVNSIPTGKWSVFHLYNQGVKIEENSVLCPQTIHFLEQLSIFMKGNSFGNAMFSVLEPGSQIEPHTGPCNFRLRCHLPLMAPPEYRIRVGTHVTSWDRCGKLLVFDDSFVHSVWHEHQREGGGKEKRVLLIFDVWHPEVVCHERKILNYAFKFIP